VTLISDKTAVPLFAIMISLPTFVGGIMWLTSIDANAKQALKETAKIEELQKALTRIEIKLGTYPKQQGE